MICDQSAIAITGCRQAVGLSCRILCQNGKNGKMKKKTNWNDRSAKMTEKPKWHKRQTDRNTGRNEAKSLCILFDFLPSRVVSLHSFSCAMNRWRILILSIIIFLPSLAEASSDPSRRPRRYSTSISPFHEPDLRFPEPFIVYSLESSFRNYFSSYSSSVTFSLAFSPPPQSTAIDLSSRYAGLV